jgi:ArsR family transcriptional regulator
VKDPSVPAGLFRAIGHPVRLEILEALLEDGEACVCHLEARLGLRQAYLSQHLARLRQVGLVIDRREGLNVFYRPCTASVRGLLEAGERLAADLGIPAANAREPRLVRGRVAPDCPCPRCQKSTLSGATAAVAPGAAAG